MQCSRLIRAFRSDHVMNGISTQESEVRRISSDLKSAKPLKPITSLLKSPAPPFIKYHSHTFLLLGDSYQTRGLQILSTKEVHTLSFTSYCSAVFLYFTETIQT